MSTDNEAIFPPVTPMPTPSWLLMRWKRSNNYAARQGCTVYAAGCVFQRSPDALIASSHVIAVHDQTVGAANNYWRE